jgi:hypothetical protein
MESQVRKEVSTAKKHSLPSKKTIGKGATPKSPSPSQAASDNPINRPSPTTLKKSIPKLPKRPGNKSLSSTSEEKSKSQTKIPTADSPDVADEGNLDDLEHEEPAPIGEPIAEPTEEYEETLETLEDSPQGAKSMSKEQRKTGSEESASASGSGGGSMFQRGKNAASRLSGFTDTVRGLSNRTTAAKSQGGFEKVQHGIRGVAKTFTSGEGDIANKPADKVTNPFTKLSQLKGFEITGERDILDGDGKAVGTIVEGEPSELVGQVVGEDGEILDEDGDLIGRVELIGEATVKQADAVEEAADTKYVPKLQDLANLPITKDGTVKDKSGRVLGQLVEGDPDDLVGEAVNENGEVLDEDGDFVGRVELISMDQNENRTGQVEHHGGVLLPTVAILRGREINEDGQILNDNGDPLGRVVEGQDPQHLSGKIPNEFGQIVDSTGEVLGQVEPVQGEAASLAMQELEQISAPIKKKDGFTEEEPEKGTTDANRPQELSQDLPDISTLEGLKCNKFGHIVGEDGVPVGELIQGNPRELSKGGFQLDERGQFWDNRGNVLGVAQTVPIEDEDESPFGDFEDLVVVEDGWIEDATGARVGQVVDGDVRSLLGRAVDDDGDILDKRGNLIGHAEPWEEPEPEIEEVDLSILEGLSPNKLGFVIGPDGVPIGRVTEGDLKVVAGRTIDDEGQVWSDGGDVIGRVEPIPEDEREVPLPFSDLGDLIVRANGLVEDEYGVVVGRLIDGDPQQLQGKAVDDDGDIMDKRGNVIGRAEPYTPSEEPEEPEEPEEDLSELEGMTVNKFGNVVDENGAVFGRLVSGNSRKLNGKKVDGEGQIWSDDGKVLGNVTLIPAAEREKPEGLFYGLDGLTATKDGSVTNSAGEVVGRLIEGDLPRLVGRAVDEDGEIVDKVGNVIGCAERWTPEEKHRDINPMSGRKVNRDGEVRDEDGNLMGRLTMGNLKALVGKMVDDNGNLVDNDGNKIGECTLEENLSEDAEELEEPEISPEEAERQAEEAHNRELAKKISGVVQQTLESVEPLCKQITEVSLSYRISHVET